MAMDRVGYSKVWLVMVRRVWMVKVSYGLGLGLVIVMVRRVWLVKVSYGW